MELAGSLIAIAIDMLYASREPDPFFPRFGSRDYRYAAYTILLVSRCQILYANL